MYPRLRPLQRGQTKPFGHRCAVRCSPHRTSSPKRERNSLTVMMDFRFNRLGFFISDILSSFVRLFKLDIHLSLNSIDSWSDPPYYARMNIRLTSWAPASLGWSAPPAWSRYASGCGVCLPALVLHPERGHSCGSSACWPRSHPETPTAVGRSALGFPATPAGAAALPALLVPRRGVTFFKPQSHLPQGQPQPPDAQTHALGLLQLLLQLPQGQIRLLADLLPQPRLHRRRHPAHRATAPCWPLDLPGARAGGGDLLGPAFAHPKLFRQLPQGPFALLIGLQKLSPQIIRVWSCHLVERRIATNSLHYL